MISVNILRIFGEVIVAIIIFIIFSVFQNRNKTISKKKQANNAEGLRLFTEMAYVGVALLEIATLKFIRVNSKFCEITGYSEEELMDRVYKEIIPEADTPLDEEMIKAVISGDKENFQSRKKFMRKDNKIIWISIHRKILRDDKLKISFLMLEIIDITTEKAATVALRKEENLFRMAIDNYPYTFVIYNKNRQLDFLNKHGLESYGVTLEHLVGKQAEEIDLWQTTESLPLLLKVFKTKKAQKKELCFIQDETELYYKVNYVPIMDDDDEIEQVFGIMQDVTAERILEQQKLQTKDVTILYQGRELVLKQHELDDSRRLSDIGGLAATVAHELRNPLGVIRTAVYNLRRKNVNINLNSHLDNIDKKVMESDRIINNLLNYARLKKPNLEPTDIIVLLEDTIKNIKKQYEKSTINLESNIKKTGSIIVNIDPFQITEVFVNILENAYQAIGQNPGNINIMVKVTPQTISISFQDNGPGIMKEDLKQIFVPFFTRKPKGTGLGLPICQELIRLHHGKIEVQSSLGHGCVFSMILPIS
ncbi:MAG: hypothetical protein A2Y40_00250 [Candidatus Margulisbacteria bacterium GWF2_35_9]|nr:MAG: hypothetical protein A2Y40_00250 [Candidatus Margulisbacteria bacterium GWF2_35_9]